MLPPAIFALFAVYVPAFLYNLTHTSPYEVISDEIDVVVRDFTGVEDDDDLNEEVVLTDENNEPLQELDVEETVVIEEKEPRIMKTLLSGMPSPTNIMWTATTFAINLALVAMVWDLTYRATYFYPSHDLSMARVGFVSDNSAKILVREPDAPKYPVFLSYRQAEAPLASGSYDSAWKSGGSLDWLDNTTDHTGTFDLTRLAPDRKYQWITSNDHGGFFTTAPRPGQVSNRLESKGLFTFVHSSCLKNNFPYSPFSHTLSNQGLKHFSRAIDGIKAQFMLFLGDFIYADVPRRHGVTAEDFRREYRQVYASPDWPDATKNLPWIHVYDDHEIANDWDGNTTSVFPSANDPYELYHTSVNPPPARKGETYFSFTQGPASFFMLDTRRYRSPNDNTNGSDPITGEATKTMLGQQQLADLLAWLKRPEPSGIRWKIVVSSIPFTKNWWYGAQDTWRGYLGERQIILEAMWDVGLRGGTGVVILSGDRHEFAATAFPPPPDGKEELTALGAIGMGATGFNPVRDGDSKNSLLTRRKHWPLSAVVHEFSASPLNMF